MLVRLCQVVWWRFRVKSRPQSALKRHSGFMSSARHRDRQRTAWRPLDPRDQVRWPPQTHLANEAVKIYTRRGHDWTNRFKKIVDDAWHISAGSAIIDGEVSVPAADGTTDFSVLQNELNGRSTRIVLVATRDADDCGLRARRPRLGRHLPRSAEGREPGLRRKYDRSYSLHTLERSSCG